MSMTSPVTLTTFSRHSDYQWREIFEFRGCNSVMGGPINLKFAGGILGNTGILERGLLEMCMIHFRENLLVWQKKILLSNKHSPLLRNKECTQVEWDLKHYSKQFF